MAWTSLTFAYGSVLTSAKMTQLYDNLAALAAGDAGAPSIVGSRISNTAAGNISSTNVQAAINELDSDKAAVAQTMYIGTTAVSINRGSGALALAGVSIDGTASSAILSTTQPVGNYSTSIATTAFVQNDFVNNDVGVEGVGGFFIGYLSSGSVASGATVAASSVYGPQGAAGPLMTSGTLRNISNYTANAGGGDAIAMWQRIS